MRAGRIVLLIAGVLIALMGLSTIAAGTGALWAHTLQQDADGYLTSPTFQLEGSGHALTSEHLELLDSPGIWSWRDQFDLRLQVTPEDPTEQVFVGIAPMADVQDYLDDVAHQEITQLTTTDVDYRTQPGARTPEPPAGQTFWAASADGNGTQTLTWTAEPGTWGVVIMNADTTAGVDVTATAGARTDALLPVGLVLLALGLVLLGGGAAMAIAAVSGAQERPAVPRQVPAPAGQTYGSYPLAVTGHLDAQLSRWQWLVKWLLLIPHLIVLVFLWLAFLVLTIAAGIAILFTGRYPRGIFDFNVGVLRWSWRVAFYGYGVLGTDRYPPFTLAETDHPAHLDVAYPEQLSRGLVLIKWWLLALPHYLIVAVLTGGAATWTYQVSADQSWQIGLGGGLIGLLALIVGVALLFTARYPAGLFDLLVGLNRWVYRVIAYAALMTDDYPPFRLDSGGDEPQPSPPAPPAPTDAGARSPQPARH
jgi:hypothetical protein